MSAAHAFNNPNPARFSRWVWQCLAGLAGAGLLAGVYFAIVSWAESPQHALDQLWQERWLVLPLIIGFGLQAALYTVLRLRLFVPLSIMQGNIDASATASGSAPTAVTGAGGATSTAAMIACCAHHVTDVLPVLGLTAAASFLAKYQAQFMLVGLATTLAGVGWMLFVIGRERRKAIAHAIACGMAASV